MKIRSFQELSLLSDKVVTNAVTGNIAKTVSLMLEAGKALQSVVTRYPNEKGINASFRDAGGIGKAPDLATLTRNVFAGLVLTGQLAEDAYDGAVMNHCKVVSPTLNILAKHAEKFEGDLANEFREEIAGIMTAKPEDAVKQLKEIRTQVEAIAGVGKEIPTPFEILAKALEENLPLIFGDDLELAYDLLAEAGKNVVQRINAEAPAPVALPAQPTLAAAA